MSIAVAFEVSERSEFSLLRKLFANKSAMVGLGLVLFVGLVAVFAPLIAPYDPLASNWSQIRKPPSPQHWLGTDELGRDSFSRIIFGARASLLAGVISVTIASVAGVPLGLLAGYVGGWFDAVVMRVIDAFLAIPFLILAIAFAAFLGPSLFNAMIAIGISAAPLFARLARGQALVVRNEEYVEAARSIGATDWLILRRTIFFNCLPPLIVQATLAIASAIIAEAALAFLGLGLQPPAPSWGSMLDSARSALPIAPWMAIFPGVAIYVTVLGFNLLGDGLHDALDPKSN